MNAVTPAHISGAAATGSRRRQRGDEPGPAEEVLGVPAVAVDAGDLLRPARAQDLVAADAVVAASARAVDPGGADGGAGFGPGDALAERLDDAGDLVAGDRRERPERVVVVELVDLGEAHPAGGDPDEDLAGAGRGDVAFDDLQRLAGCGENGAAHGCAPFVVAMAAAPTADNDDIASSIVSL
nr:hypothetical protein [Actinomadura sp. CNU-125]